MKLIIFQFADKQCQTVAQQVSQFNGCSVPDWMPNDLVNTPGDSMMDSLSIISGMKRILNLVKITPKYLNPIATNMTFVMDVYVIILMCFHQTFY